MSTINRVKFLNALTACRPALATQDLVPAYVHFLFTSNRVTAFNDQLGICVALPEHGIDGCLHGDKLIKALQSMAGEEVLVQTMEAERAVLVSCGRAKIKLPLLPADHFPITWPSTKDADFFAVTADMVKGLGVCLPGVGTNQNQPAQMGVTVTQDDDGPMLWSTDGNTLTRYMGAEDRKFKLPGRVPLIMPTPFCEQVLGLAKAYPKADQDIIPLPGMVVCECVMDEKLVARVMCRTLVDLAPLDFEAVLSRHLRNDQEWNDLPAGWEDALQRALVVAGNDVDKVTKFTKSRGALKMETKGDTSEGEDMLDFGGDVPDKTAIDPVLLLRGSKRATSVAFGSKALLLKGDGGSYLHMVAYYGN